MKRLRNPAPGAISPRLLRSLSPLPSPLVFCPLSRRERVRVRAGFTLVEMLVVIAIIGILAGLTIPAVMVVMRRVKEAAIGIEINQLDMACKAYKEKFGEYPPDFANVTDPALQQIILRHLAKAFPRYQPANWAAFRDHVLAEWYMNVEEFSPATALTFFLGGKPDWLDLLVEAI